jgi:hypothetical protein
VCELRRIEGRLGLVPGHLRMIKGLLGTKWRVWDWRERDWACDKMKLVD